MLEIEIVETNIIEGGIEVFARAWRDSVQIGFGKDGTVDIERFEIFNPPVLVNDVNGDIIREFQQRDENDVMGTRQENFREDAEEAILQSLEHTIKAIQKFDDKNIVSDKRGNTTSTFHPVAGQNSPVDGLCQINAQNTWALARDGTTSSTALPDNAALGDFNCRIFASKYYLARGYFTFDTSAIDDTDTIDSAILSFYQVSGGSNPDSNEFAISGATLDSAADLTTGDWDSQTLDTPTEFATRQVIPSGANNEYKDWTLNASGEAHISKTATSEFSLRWEQDVDDVAANTNNNNLNGCYKMADYTGTTQDPKLVVEHSAGAAGFTPTPMMHVLQQAGGII